MDNYKYFKLSEFSTPGLDNGHKMDRDFVAILDSIRAEFGKPMRVTSGYRTKAYNEDLIKRGYAASSTSSHLKGVAADISCTNSKDRIRLIEIALKHNIRRIGISSTFLHFDDDADKNIACWTY
tara:strand:- start:51 stop:422 length:372 start_codon:yes stop_codon:yes gene_type:complete